MRDKYYLGLCDYPQRYDAVIDLIKEKNPYASVPDSRYNDAEDFATECVHSCIRAVKYGGNKWSSTGGCLAVLDALSDKVMLAYIP